MIYNKLKKSLIWLLGSNPGGLKLNIGLSEFFGNMFLASLDVFSGTV